MPTGSPIDRYFLIHHKFLEVFPGNTSVFNMHFIIYGSLQTSQPPQPHALRHVLQHLLRVRPE